MLSECSPILVYLAFAVFVTCLLVTLCVGSDRKGKEEDDWEDWV